MTNEELMKPRYKVIADYPHNPYGIGDLVETCLHVPYPSFLCTETSYEEDGRSVSCGNWVQLTEIEKYPHLFRRLEWWEQRKIEDMPEYVKVNTEHTCLFLGNVLKVRQWKTRFGSNQPYCWVEEDKSKSFPDMFKYDADSFLPATEAEYLAELNTTKQQDNG